MGVMRGWRAEVGRGAGGGLGQAASTACHQGCLTATIIVRKPPSEQANPQRLVGTRRDRE